MVALCPLPCVRRMAVSDGDRFPCVCCVFVCLCVCVLCVCVSVYVPLCLCVSVCVCPHPHPFAAAKWYADNAWCLKCNLFAGSACAADYIAFNVHKERLDKKVYTDFDAADGKRLDEYIGGFGSLVCRWRGGEDRLAVCPRFSSLLQSSPVLSTRR